MDKNQNKHQQIGSWTILIAPPHGVVMNRKIPSFTTYVEKTVCRFRGGRAYAKVKWLGNQNVVHIMLYTCPLCHEELMCGQKLKGVLYLTRNF